MIHGMYTAVVLQVLFRRCLSISGVGGIVDEKSGGILICTGPHQSGLADWPLIQTAHRPAAMRADWMEDKE